MEWFLILTAGLPLALYLIGQVRQEDGRWTQSR